MHPMRMRTALRNNVDARLGDGTFILREKENKNILLYTVNAFSDFISTALCNILSNTAAAVAITIEPKVMRMPIKIPPDRSSPLLFNRMNISSTTTKPTMAMAQYLIVRKACTAASEKTLFCQAYPSTLKD